MINNKNFYILTTIFLIPCISLAQSKLMQVVPSVTVLILNNNASINSSNNLEELLKNKTVPLKFKNDLIKMCSHEKGYKKLDETTQGINLSVPTHCYNKFFFSKQNNVPIPSIKISQENYNL